MRTGWPSRVQPEGEKGGKAGDDGLGAAHRSEAVTRASRGNVGTNNDGEGDAEVVRQAPVPLQLLLIPELRQPSLVLLLGGVGGSTFARCLLHFVGSRSKYVEGIFSVTPFCRKKDIYNPGNMDRREGFGVEEGSLNYRLTSQCSTKITRVALKIGPWPIIGQLLRGEHMSLIRFGATSHSLAQDHRRAYCFPIFQPHQPDSRVMWLMFPPYEISWCP